MGRLQGKKVLFVVAHEFEDIGLWYPLLCLSDEGARCYILAIKEGATYAAGPAGKVCDREVLELPSHPSST